MGKKGSGIKEKKKREKMFVGKTEIGNINTQISYTKRRKLSQYTCIFPSITLINDQDKMNPDIKAKPYTRKAIYTYYLHLFYKL